jgi:hypothetical protein
MLRSRLFCACLTTLSLCAPVSAEVQLPSHHDRFVGLSTRVTHATSVDGLELRRTHTGRIIQLTDSVLVLDMDRDRAPLEIERSKIEHAEVRTRESKRLQGSILGTLSGAGLGALLGLTVGDGYSSGITESFVWTGTAAGASLGAVLGALLAPGALWEEISPAQLEAVRIGTTGGSPALIVGFTF